MNATKQLEHEVFVTALNPTDLEQRELFSDQAVVVTSHLPALIHRYRFDETSGTTAHDSVADQVLHWHPVPPLALVRFGPRSTSRHPSSAGTNRCPST